MFDNRLKSLREARGLSQKELGELLGLKDRTYTSYENNEREPASKTLIAISQYFGVTVDYLLGIHGNRNDISDKYNCLDEHGKQIIDLLLNFEYERCNTQIEHTTTDDDAEMVETQIAAYGGGIEKRKIPKKPPHPRDLI